MKNLAIIMISAAFCWMLAAQEPQATETPATVQEQTAPVQETPPAENQPPAEETPPAEQQPQPETQPQNETQTQQDTQPQQPAPANAAAVTTEAPATAAQEKKPEEGKEEKKEEKKEPPKFVKGEISNIGARDIVYPYNSLGVGTGFTRIDQKFFLTLDPRFTYNKNDFNMLMSFHLPVNIQLFTTDLSAPASDNFTIRKEDWDEWQDYFRLIKYIQYGRSEDNLYIAVGSNIAQTLGHGTIMKRYVPNFDYSTTKISGKLNYYNDYFGFESVLGDITDGNMFGALVFFKPLSFFLDDYRSKSFSIGFTFVGDRKAPSMLQYVDYIDMPDGNDPTWPEGVLRRIDSDDKGRPIVLDDEFLYLMGLDAEFKVFKNDYVDIKTFVDYSWIKKDLDIGGFTFGALGRFNVDDERKHVLRARLEGRMYDDAYIPNFFDAFYDVERIEMMTNIFGASDFTPDGRSKYWHLVNDSEHKKFFSLYTEFNYTFIDWISISLGFEKLQRSYSLFAHLELPDLWIFKGMFSYYQRGITTFRTIAEDSDISSILRGVVRIELLPILFINGYIGKQWAFVPEKKTRSDKLQGHYLSSWDFGVDVEIGWEWGGDDEDEKKKEEEKKEEEEKK